ncbi:MAG: CYTH and CHAD domain-containing protein, partial [Myxococcota bacterium]|nr:CYTH and CHAD domain-containing protein [Myxococcota bacterium]
MANTISLERELKLSAPAGFRLPDLGGLDPRLSVATQTSRRMNAVYWDTRDLRLTRWDCGLRYRDLDGWTLKLPATGDGPEVVRRELHFEGPRERPPTAALDMVLGVIRREPLLPVVRLQTDRDEVRIRDAAGRLVAEVVNDRVASLEGREVGRRFREVEVEFSEDCPREVVEEIVARLRRAGTGSVQRVAKHVRALGLEAGVDPEIPVPELDASSSVGDVVRRALGRSVVALIGRDAGVRLDESIEDVHRMRVATRRLRSHLRSFAALFAEGMVRELQAELRWLGGELGRVRDADVLGERLRAAVRELPPEEARDAKDMLDHLAEQRHRAYVDLLASLRSSRYVDLVERLVETARAPALCVAPSEPGRRAMKPLVAASWRRLRKRARKLGEEPADAALHAVRIRAKHVRYAAEVVAPLYGVPARELARAARGVQQVLGEHQDAVVARAWLREA